MNATAENGFLPAFTEEQLAEVSMKEANKHTETIRQMCNGDFEATKEHLADLAQAFALGACEAVSRAKDGEAVRTFQWKYGTGYLLKRMHEILDENNAAARNQQIDPTGGAMGNGEDREESDEAPGYVIAGAGAVIDDLAAADAREAASKALADLPANLRQVVKLRVLADMSFDKIAKALNTNKMDVFYRYNEGIKLMRRQFAA